MEKEDEEMKRLTTDKNASEMSMIELAHNSCYADKERRARYRDYELDIDARDLAKMLINDMCNEDLSSMTDEEFDNYIKEMLADGMNSQIGLIALFYRNVWAMADLREKLADYEDTGMTPEQVIEMQMDWVAIKAAYPKWIPVTERLPEEHDSIFAKFKGTEKWKKVCSQRFPIMCWQQSSAKTVNRKYAQQQKQETENGKTIFSERTAMRR